MERKDTGLLDRELLTRLGNLAFEARGFVSGGFSGRHRSSHRGSSVDFAQYRKYVPGDDIKHIDWRVFGRTERYFVKEFDADTNMRCHLVLDSSHSMAYEHKHGSKIDYAKKLMAVLAHILVQQGDSVGLQSFDVKMHTDIPPRQSPRHLHALMETLAGIKAGEETDLANNLDMIAGKTRNRALIIVFSDFFTEPEELNKVFGHFAFKKHDLAIFHLVDEMEMNFEITQPTRFVDMEGRSSLMVEPELIRGRYLKMFDDYLKELRACALKNQVDYRLARTGEDPEKVLSSFLLDRIIGRGRK